MADSELLHYRIKKPLGSGGMGDVYLAEDLRLKRLVAIKILLPLAAARSDSRYRFEREAQAIAALNYPNIVTIYSVERAASTSEAGDRYFITMEYVDGRTLADLLPKHGFPLRRLLTMAIQIADAVSNAHQHGIVHRDLKPANVMLTGSDRVKVLDFGLAKLLDATVDASPDALPTRELTGEGTIVGTVAYMSPEQAEDKVLDERSDIFSLGVMLYEMATGVRPFKGDSNVSILSSVLRDTPKTLTELNPEMPCEFARIVRHCLVKDPERRYQSAKDLRNELEELQQTLTSGELTAAPQRTGVTWRSTAAAGLGAMGLVALVAAIWLKTSPGPSPAPPTAMHTRLTQLEGIERFPSVSPDGKWLVYASGGDIYLQSVTGQTPINITRDSVSTETTPTFAPDGESIAFRSDRDGGGIFVMGRTGEAVRRVTTQGFLPAWLQDGRQLVFSTDGPESPAGRAVFSELWIVDTHGGQPRQLFGGDAVQPRVSPHEMRIAFWALPLDAATKRTVTSSSGQNRDIWTVNIRGEDPVRVTTHDSSDWNPVWSPDGRWLYFLSDRAGSMNLWRVAIDEASGVTSGEPQPLTAPAPYVSDFSLSADGTVGAYSSILRTVNIGRVDFAAKSGTTRGAIATVTSGTNEFRYIDVTRDGRSIVTSTFLPPEDLYVVPLEGGVIRRVTSDMARDRAPRWTADGRHILFYSDRGGRPEIWRIGTDGGGLQQMATSGAIFPVPSRDGTRVVASDTSPLRHLLIFDANDFSRPLETLPQLTDSTVLYPVASDWSPDGRQIVIEGVGSLETVWVYSLETRGYRGFGEGQSPAWLADGRRIVYAKHGRLWALDTISGDSNEVLAVPGESLDSPVSIVGDSQLLFTRTSESSDIWTVRFGQK